MSLAKWLFCSWTRDKHKVFAKEIIQELEKKADVDSPNFTGIPLGPTAEPGTQSKQFATTEFVSNALNEKASKNGDTFIGNLVLDIPPGNGGKIYPVTIKGKYSETTSGYEWKLGISTVGTTFYIRYNSEDIIGVSPVLGIFPVKKTATLGYEKGPWSKTFTQKINNGADIDVPQKAGTMALLSDIEDTLRKYNLIS